MCVTGNGATVTFTDSGSTNIGLLIGDVISIDALDMGKLPSVNNSHLGTLRYEALCPGDLATLDELSLATVFDPLTAYNFSVDGKGAKGTLRVTFPRIGGGGNTAAYLEGEAYFVGEDVATIENNERIVRNMVFQFDNSDNGGLTYSPETTPG